MRSVTTDSRTEASHRTPLPAEGELWITDAGLETELVFKDGLELPCFSAAPLLDSEWGRERLRRYYSDFIALAVRHGIGLLLETATWRVSPDWAHRLGLDEAATARIHAEAVGLLRSLRKEGSLPSDRFVVSGNLGPRYDGYRVDERMEPSEAFDYHHGQVTRFAAEGADAISALTLTTSEEAIGIARAAAAEALPSVISFTVETDGRLPSGETLESAITAVDASAPDSHRSAGIGD